MSNAGRGSAAPNQAEPPTQTPLPIDGLQPRIAAALAEAPNLVIEAAPGAGKTTRVPPLVLSLVKGEVLVLEPRRIAARLAAMRASAEMGEPLGETVGYQVRFEAVGGPQTRLRFLTEGVLTRRLISDPDLQGVDAVILDEFHERHLDTDLALVLLKRLQERRPELRLVVMSATLESAPIAAYLDGCPVLRSQGREHPLEIRYQTYSALPLEQQVRNVVESTLHDGQRGHILVFLPGAAEIHRCIRSCEGLAQSFGALLLPLFGDLPPEEQDRALKPSTKQKVIFTTNIAESSVTIDGVTTVIDSGLARIASHSTWTGLPILQVGRVSKASAIQRAGRAGRTGPGTVVRLYPAEDFAQRPDHELPALMRSDLAGMCLSLRAMGIEQVTTLPWFMAPPAQAVEEAEELLHRLGVDARNVQELARFPLPPRFARMLVEAKRLGALEQAIAVATLLGSGGKITKTDLVEAVAQPLSANALRQQRQLRTLTRSTRHHGNGDDDEALLQAVLVAFPDRVAQRRSGNQILLANGLTMEVPDAAAPYQLVTVLEGETRSDRVPLARLVARVEPEWLLDRFPEQMRDDTWLEWNEKVERVEVVNALSFGAVRLEESRGGRPDPDRAAALLAEKALLAGTDRFLDGHALSQLFARFSFAGLERPDVSLALTALCEGLRSFAELQEAAEGLLSKLQGQAGMRLRELAPEVLRLTGGRQVKVMYEEGKPPWIASRLQDFFGMTETPRIGPGKTAVIVHLLAPNQRAVQTTADLAGFWARLYPQVRRELMRRYPRHAWPEKPDQALATKGK